MAVTSATIQSINTDSGTIGDFFTDDQTLTFGGVYTAGFGTPSLFLWIDGVLAGSISVFDDSDNAPWTRAVGTALADGIHTVVINTSNANVAAGVMDTQAVLIDTDGTVAASDLLALDADVAVTVDASSVTTLTGTVADVAAAYASAGIGGLGNEAVTLSGTTMAAASLTFVDGATTGPIDASSATLLTGDLTALRKALTATGISGLGDEDLVVDKAIVLAGQLDQLTGLTTGTVDASAVDTLLASISAAKTVFANIDIIGLGDVNVSLTDKTAAAADLNRLNGATTGTVDMKSVNTVTGALADLLDTYTSSGFGGRGDEAITLSDTSAAATDLNTLNAATTGTINMASVLTVTGTLADLAVTYSTIGFSGKGNEAITLSDATVAATDLNSLDGKTTGLIDASSVTLLTGSVSAVAAASASAGISLANAAYDVTGTKGLDTIVGSAHGDRLNGIQGNDTLTGGGGDDTFVFTTALNGTSNVDQITDFADGEGDVIELASTIFAGLATEPGGQLAASAFALDTATGAGPQIVYNSATGALFYDKNGAGAGGATQFATLSSLPVLDHADFLVV